MRFVLSKRSPEWGVGVVKRDLPGGKVEVLFSEGGCKLLVGSMAALEPVDDAEVPEGSPLRDEVRWPEVENRKAAAATFDGMIEEFLRTYPGGFKDKDYQLTEREYKEKAVAVAHDVLARERLSALLKAGDFAECHRTAGECASCTNLIFTNEKIKLRAIPPAAHEVFARSLFELLHGAGDYAERVAVFADALADYEAGKWTIATYFGFLLDPVGRAFVKPTAVQRAAKALRRELGYEPHPNAAVYRRVAALCQDVRAQLEKRKLKPKDMIDIQGFLWIGTGMHKEMR